MTKAPVRLDFYRGTTRLQACERTGVGTTTVFQHGLCADALQTFALMPDDAPLVTLDCRGHGGSEVGELALLSIDTFAADLAAYVAFRSFGPVVLGGTSLGAAVALNACVRQPILARALVLTRPAWTVAAAPPNLHPYAAVGMCLAREAAPAARETFLQGSVARQLAADAPASLERLLLLFENPSPATAALLTCIPKSDPGVSTADLAALAIPTLVVGQTGDPLHPLAQAETLAGLIPGAQLVVVPGKETDRAAHVAQFHLALETFVNTLEERSGSAPQTALSNR